MTSPESTNVLPTNDCACVVGWHFSKEVLASLATIPQLTIHVACHKPRERVPAYVSEFVDSQNLHILPNEGYDWGAFQQFLELGLHSAYRNVFFLHDDLRILDTGFRDACNERLDAGFIMVGNGRAGSRSNWLKRAYPAVYSNSVWLPPSQDFEHATVRGSFFAMTSKTLARLGHFEVFWDRFSATPNFGNWSLVSSCGRAEATLGGKGITWLGDTYLESRFILEGKRGVLMDGIHSAGTTTARNSGIKTISFRLYRNISDKYVALRLRHSPLAKLLEPFVRYPGSRRWPPVSIHSAIKPTDSDCSKSLN